MSFQSLVADFKKVSAAEAEAAIAGGEKFVLFIGRQSCPYCNFFLPKLHEVVTGAGQATAFLNSEDLSDQAGIQRLRQTYGVPTVPGLLVAEAGHVKVVCDSSLSEESIADFIGF